MLSYQFSAAGTHWLVLEGSSVNDEGVYSIEMLCHEGDNASSCGYQFLACGDSLVADLQLEFER